MHTDIKNLILRSVVLSKEQKEDLIGKIDRFRPAQIELLYQLLSTEKDAKDEMITDKLLSNPELKKSYDRQVKNISSKTFAKAESMEQSSNKLKSLLGKIKNK